MAGTGPPDGIDREQFDMLRYRDASEAVSRFMSGRPLGCPTHPHYRAELPIRQRADRNDSATIQIRIG
jgi:hypothetical protein